ncbi:unnamed protein product [Phaeothamnion confervicola]
MELASLSGGQQALLGLSFVVALSSSAASPLYIFDEVDAALDLSKQDAVARLIGDTFAGSQVLCVSHHAAFHRLAGQMLPIAMGENGSQYVG